MSYAGQHVSGSDARPLLCSSNCREDSFCSLPIPGPILLGTTRDAAAPEKVGRDWHDLEPHREEDQVKLDVNRSFVYYPIGIV